MKRVVQEELASPPLDAFADIIHDTKAASKFRAMSDAEASSPVSLSSLSSQAVLSLIASSPETVSTHPLLPPQTTGTCLGFFLPFFFAFLFCTCACVCTRARVRAFMLFAYLTALVSIKFQLHVPITFRVNTFTFCFLSIGDGDTSIQSHININTRHISVFCTHGDPTTSLRNTIYIFIHSLIKKDDTVIKYIPCLSPGL